MKYLKLFEDIGGDFQEITPDEGCKFISSSDPESLSNNDVYLIKSTLRGYCYKPIHRSETKNGKEIVSTNTIFISKTIREKKYGSNVVSEGRVKYEISKFQDDWFIVHDFEGEKIRNGNHSAAGHQYYKCDQITGVIECLKKIEP